jgi:hypothetical protein
MLNIDIPIALNRGDVLWSTFDIVMDYGSGFSTA